MPAHRQLQTSKEKKLSNKWINRQVDAEEWFHVRVDALSDDRGELEVAIAPSAMGNPTARHWR